jgi:hypothetical protein
MASLGTSINLVPVGILYDLVKATNGQYDFNTGFYQVDCSTKFTWSVFIGQKELKVDQSTLFMHFHDVCYLSFGAWEDDDHNIDIILGVPFLQSFCVSHDIQKGQLGFSKGK